MYWVLRKFHWYWFALVKHKGGKVEGTLIHPAQLQGSNWRLIRKN